MISLPGPETYEREYEFMPWGSLIQEILGWVVKNIPPQSRVLDLMCGPAYLLGLLAKARPDLVLTGLDIDQRYIDFARGKYPSVHLIQADILQWKPDCTYNFVLCTGGLHHISFDRQVLLLNLIAQCLERAGVCILADPFIEPYASEKERRLAATHLGCEYLKAVIEKEAPDIIAMSALMILHRDVLLIGEYKTCLENFLEIARPLFEQIEVHKTWPAAVSEYGDYYMIMSV